MQFSTIQQRIYAGYAQAAARVGPSYSWYRPTSASNPLNAANLMGTIKASLSTDAAFTYKKGNGYGKPQWFALVDGTRVLPNDYLTDGANTWFIADLPALLPISCVNCNRTITVSRPTNADGVGLLDYGGDTAETAVMTAWPASVLQGTRGERGDTNLPGDTRLPWWSILLPAFPGAQIEAFDVATDDSGQRYKIASTELTELGWRLTASLAQT